MKIATAHDGADESRFDIDLDAVNFAFTVSGNVCIAVAAVALHRLKIKNSDCAPREHTHARLIAIAVPLSVWTNRVPFSPFTL